MAARRAPSVERRLKTLQREVTGCERCPELRRYCVEVGEKKQRKAYAGQTYWARPVPSFGDPVPGRILIVGLAPGAHGANRTGRIFTGDRSGDFLYTALHRVGLANQPHAVHRRDGLKLRDTYIVAALHCAPPANKPTTLQLGRCRDYLVREIDTLRPRVTMCLGGIAWTATLRALGELDQEVPRPRPTFGHGVEYAIGFTTLVGSYHVSQQNTFTGRLTEAMLDKVLARAKKLAGV